MKKTTFLGLILFCALTAIAQPTDFITSGIVAPQRLLVSGNNVYVKGENTIYVVDVSQTTPIATPIFTAGLHQYLANFTLSGTLLYVAIETLDATETQSVNNTISKIDLLNTGAGAVSLYSTGNGDYISALTISANTLFFTVEKATTELSSFDVTITNPVPTTIVSGLGIVEDIEFKNNIVYASDRTNQKVYTIDTASATPTLVTLANLNFNKGIFINNDDIYITDSNQVKKGSLSTAAPIPLDVIGTNSDSDNFRDVVLIGNKMYLALEEDHKIVTIVDATLSNKEFESSGFSLLNSNDSLTLNGLDSKQKVSIYNLLGKAVIDADLEASNNSLSIANLSAGVYVLKLNDTGASIKFVKD